MPAFAVGAYEMSSPLLPSTVALLATVKPRAPLFSNAILAELFDARHTRGAFKLLPSAEGGYVVFDTRAELGAGVVSWHPTEGEAHAALEHAGR
jgi:hypothetical protein